MSRQEQLALIEASLERAAELLGDITEPVMQRYYQRHPTVAAKFEELSPGVPSVLEGQMVENTLYCFMVWFKSPGEIRILLSESALHHLMTLGISLESYGDLIVAAAEVITDTIPDTQGAERAAWQEMETELLALVYGNNSSSSPVRHAQHPLV